MAKKVLANVDANRIVAVLLGLISCISVRHALASAADSAKSSSSSQGLAQVMSLAVGGMLTQQCAETKNPGTCTNAALAASQALSLGTTKSAAADAAVAASTTSTTTATTTDTTDYGSLTGTSAKQNESTARAVLTDSGYSLSADGSTLTTPSGSTVSASSMSGESGMSSAGLSASQIAQAKAALADARAAALALKKNASLSVDEGGGGGGGSGSSGRDKKDSANSYSFGGPSRRGKPNVSGMTKNFGGEKIGVSGDDIFEMITRRYKSQDASNLFIQN